jgi:hypothetical protein
MIPIKLVKDIMYLQGIIESCADILTTSYWLHVELGKNILKILKCGFLVLKHISYRLLRIGVHFIKHDIQGVFLKCAEILPTRL